MPFSVFAQCDPSSFQKELEDLNDKELIIDRLSDYSLNHFEDIYKKKDDRCIEVSMGAVFNYGDLCGVTDKMKVKTPNFVRLLEKNEHYLPFYAAYLAKLYKSTGKMELSYSEHVKVMDFLTDLYEKHIDAYNSNLKIEEGNRFCCYMDKFVSAKKNGKLAELIKREFYDREMCIGAPYSLFKMTIDSLSVESEYNKVKIDIKLTDDEYEANGVGFRKKMLTALATIQFCKKRKIPVGAELTNWIKKWEKANMPKFENLELVDQLKGEEREHFLEVVKIYLLAYRIKLFSFDDYYQCVCIYLENYGAKSAVVNRYRDMFANCTLDDYLRKNYKNRLTY